MPPACCWRSAHRYWHQVCLMMLASGIAVRSGLPAGLIRHTFRAAKTLWPRDIRIQKFRCTGDDRLSGRRPVCRSQPIGHPPADPLLTDRNKKSQVPRPPGAGECWQGHSTVLPGQGRSTHRPGQIHPVGKLIEWLESGRYRGPQRQSSNWNTSRRVSQLRPVQSQR